MKTPPLVAEEGSGAPADGGPPGPAAFFTPVKKQSEQNGTPTRGAPKRTPLGGTPEGGSPYITGGIVKKRSSYSGSVASESMDHKETISMCARVSHDLWAEGQRSRHQPGDSIE